MDVKKNSQTNEIVEQNHVISEKEMESLNQVERKKGKKLLTKISAGIKNLYSNVLHRYPITMGAIFVTILFDEIVYKRIYSFLRDEGSFLFKIQLFLLLFAIGSLFVEQCLIKKKSRKIICCIVNVFFSSIISWISTSEADNILGMRDEVLKECTSRFTICYILVLAIVSGFYMYKESHMEFALYIRSVVCNAIRTLFIYWILSIGFEIIIFIFNSLIVDTYEFYLSERIQLFITGAFLVPGLIMAVSKAKESISKFEKIVIDYVLVVLTVVAFLIIYIYLIKIIVLHELPSNEVFPILTALFCGGVFIWTVAMADTKNLMGKIAKFMPFLFLPCIIIQCICIGLRINEYGITFTRYMGCQLIVFEIFYCCLYVVKRNKIIANCAFVLIAQLIITILVPGINVYASVVRSQSEVMEQYNLSELDTYCRQEVRSFTTAYDAIKQDGSVEGMNYLEARYTIDECNRIEQIDLYDYSDGITRISVDMQYPEEVSVDGYSTWYLSYFNQENGENLEPVIITTQINGEKISEDITSFITYYIDHQEEFSEDDSIVAKPFVLSDGNCAYFLNFSFQYNEAGEVSDFYGDIILLVQ